MPHQYQVNKVKNDSTQDVAGSSFLCPSRLLEHFLITFGD